MSFAMRVHASFPCAHAWDDGIVSSRSDASSRASIVAIVCSISSRIAPRTVAAMDASCGESAFLRRVEGFGTGCVVGDIDHGHDVGEARSQEPFDTLPDGHLRQAAALTAPLEAEL